MRIHRLNSIYDLKAHLATQVRELGHRDQRKASLTDKRHDIHLNKLASFSVPLHQLPIATNIQHEVIMLLASEPDVGHGRLRPQNLLLPDSAHGDSAGAAVPARVVVQRRGGGRGAQAPQQAHGGVAEGSPRGHHGRGHGWGAASDIQARERGAGGRGDNSHSSHGRGRDGGRCAELGFGAAGMSLLCPVPGATVHFPAWHCPSLPGPVDHPLRIGAPIAVRKALLRNAAFKSRTFPKR